MVRAREKKAKGDSAFTTRQQKVGRKKLAPATATRAEVHARTIRLSTSTAMSAVMTAPQVANPAAHPPSSATTTAGRKKSEKEKESEDKRKRPVIAVQNFAELMAGTHHYKAAQRASAFATLTRLLQSQREKEKVAAAAAHGIADTSNAFDAYMRHAATESAAAAVSTGKLQSLTELTPLERLKAFAAALEAVTDTEDDVRRGAMQSLEVLVDYQWIAPGRDGVQNNNNTNTSGPAAASSQDMAELQRCDALLAHAAQDDFLPAQESKLSPSATSVAVDRVQAILQAVHVALTHAMKAVRISGVELLGLLLRVAPAPLICGAARAVCRHQNAYYHSVVAVMQSGLTMGQPSASAAGTTSRSHAQELEVEEEKWMLTLVRRVSALVLRTPQVAILPMLLGVFLGQDKVGTADMMEDLQRSPLTSGGVHRDAEVVGGSSNGQHGAPRWCQPELVSAFFDEVAPQWANKWKELMELRLELLRQEDKLAAASAVARSFAIVLVFLKRQQQVQVQQRHRSARLPYVNLFSRNRMSYMKSLFIEKLPVTLRELLTPTSLSSSSSPFLSGNAVSASGMKVRLELGLAVIMVCVPLAGTDDGWQLMREYFSIVFSLPPKTESEEKEAVAPVSPFRFPSLSQLEMSVRLFEQALKLYPCTAIHVHTMDGYGAAASDSSAAVWTLESSSDALNFVDGQPAGVSGPHQHLQQHSTVAERLLGLFPALVNTVVRHTAPRTEVVGRTSTSASAAVEDAALVRTLLCTAGIVERFAVLPEELLRVGSRGKAEHQPTKRLEEGLALVPRLLFAFRTQTQHQQVSSSSSSSGGMKRARDSEDSSKESAEGGGAKPPMEVVMTRSGVLLSYPGIVDALVRRLLRVLWFLSSGRHPLLYTTGPHAAASSTSDFALLLRKTLPLLFGNERAGISGVLQRCSVITVLLAHGTLFYLNDADSTSVSPSSSSNGNNSTGVEATVEATPMVLAAQQWAGVQEAVRTIHHGW